MLVRYEGFSIKLENFVERELLLKSVSRVIGYHCYF